MVDADRTWCIRHICCKWPLKGVNMAAGSIFDVTAHTGRKCVTSRFFSRHLPFHFLMTSHISIAHKTANTACERSLLLTSNSQQCLLAFSLHLFLLQLSVLVSVSSPLSASLPSVMLSSTTLVVCIAIFNSMFICTCINARLLFHRLTRKCLDMQPCVRENTLSYLVLLP